MAPVLIVIPRDLRGESRLEQDRTEAMSDQPAGESGRAGAFRHRLVAKATSFRWLKTLRLAILGKQLVSGTREMNVHCSHPAVVMLDNELLGVGRN